MKFALLAVALCVMGCDSKAKQQKLAADEAAFHAALQAQTDALQWDLDQATADSIFVRHYSDASDEPTKKWLTLRHCHDLGLTTGRVCGPLFDEIHRAEDRAAKQQKEKDEALRAANR